VPNIDQEQGAFVFRRGDSYVCTELLAINWHTYEGLNDRKYTEHDIY
jgi:hypothetical protein